VRLIADWFLRSFEDWLRAKRGLTLSQCATAFGNSTAVDSRSLPAETLISWILDCGRELLLRNRHPQGQACLLGAMQIDPTLVQEIAKRMQGEGAAMANACLRLSTATAQAAKHDPNLGWEGRPDTVKLLKISVVICSIDEERFAAVRDNYAQALGSGAYEVIRISDARSLAEGYNRGLDQSSGEIVVFSHDDIRILSPGFRAELSAALEANDLVGVAGSSRLAGPQWFSCKPEERYQLVCYPPTSLSPMYLCGIDGSGVDRWQGGIQCLDGLFIAGRRQVFAQLRFDAHRYDGFHFYDLDLSYRAFLAGFRLAVCTRLGLMHLSIGGYDAPDWQRYAERFCEQYDLPMNFGQPSYGIGFESEAELVTFMVLNFAWQNALNTNTVLDGIESGRPGTVWQQASTEPEKVLLHVGRGSQSSAYAGPGFQSRAWREICVDSDPTGTPDLVGSIMDLSVVPSCSVDAVFFSNALEQLYIHEVPQALTEVRRVLRNTGVVVARVHDLQAVARKIADDRLFEIVASSPLGPVTPFDIFFGHRNAAKRDHLFATHHCGFTSTSIVAAFKEAGFLSVVALPRRPHFDLQVLAIPAEIPSGLLEALVALHFQE